MIVCHCRKVTDRDLRAAIAAGAKTEAELGRYTGAGTCCGGCRPTIGRVLLGQGQHPPVVILSAFDAE